MSDESNRSSGTDFLEILLVLAREKKLILQVTLGATILAAIIVFIIPKSYTATATILPPQQNQSVLSAMMGQLAGTQSLDLRDLGLKNPSDVFVAMLKSRTVEDALVNRFDLRKVYGVKSYQDARKKLEKRSEIDPEKEGLISIAVTDRDPRRAADIANAWVEELRALNQNLALTEAAQRRAFFEQKLVAERNALSQAELALKQIEQQTGIIQPDAQTRALIGEVAEVRAQIAAKEVQLQSMGSYATSNNPDVKRVETELAKLRAQFASLSRTQATAAPSEGNLQVPTGRVAGAGLEYLQAARIDEAKSAVVVQVVDKAV